MMKAHQLIAYGEPLVFVASPLPQAVGTEVLLRVAAAGVCHTDLHVQDGGFDLGGGKSLSFKDRGIALPLTPGHETVGTPVALGPDAAEISYGHNYLVYPWIGCGDCATCRGGDENLCPQPRFLGVHRDGGYADHILIPHPRYLIDIGDRSPAAMAPLACSGLTVFSAIAKLGQAIHDAPVLVLGAGGLGLMCIALLKALGARGAVVVDVDERKLEAARSAGAIAAVDGRSVSAVQAVTDALMGPAQSAIDCVGSTASARLAFDCLGKRGRIILVGLYGGAADWPLPLIPIKAASIIGSYVGNLQELKELVQLVLDRKVALPRVSQHSCSEVNEILGMLRRGEIAGRAVLVP
jgi:propanol-preferring alcohol dehydrogenase